MSKAIIGNEQSAYERWELPDVTDPASQGGIHNRLLTAGQLEALQKQAYEEGFTQGKADGFAAGKDKLDEQLKNIKHIMQALQQPLLQLDDAVVTQLVDMVTLVAAQVIRRELRADPGQVVAAVRECIKALPVGSSHVKVFLHPEDAQIVRDAFSLDEGVTTWKIVEEPVMTRGGCRVETQHSKIDASVEQQLNRVIAALLGGERERDSE